MLDRRAPKRIAPRQGGALPGGWHPQSFTALYEQMHPSVLRFFARETREPHRAFDLTAETFAKAFERRADFRGHTEKQAAGWIWMIARNQLARYGRSHTVELSALRRLRLERPAPSAEELRHVEELTVREELREQLAGALATLPVEQRAVLQLRFVEQLGYEEIAEQIGVTAEVARKRSSRALRSLRANGQLRHAIKALEA
jgi:RNA polymerase sigma-70 factor, ECF subfamily